MKTLGLTGGIGSGKTTVAKMLAEKPGVRVVYADDVAKRLMQEDPALRAALIARFGPQTYNADGSLNRSGLAAAVFGQAEETLALNGIVHPAVRKAMVAEIERARADGVKLLVYEAALLYEVGADKLLDHVLTVYAPTASRRTRGMARDGVDRKGVEARMRHQLGPGELRERADAVIENTRDLNHLRREVDEMYEELMALPG